MQLISVNIGKSRDIENAKSSGKTGIYKESVRTPIQITTNGLVGDTICDVKHHGGIDQAVYIYGQNDYNWWQDALKRELLPGTFDENLTISELASSTFSVGDNLIINDVVLQVTATRVPCVTLAARMQDNKFIQKFLKAERPGLYCRVLCEGTVCKGDSVIKENYSGDTITVLEMFRNFFNQDYTEASIRRYLNAPYSNPGSSGFGEKISKYQ